MSMFFKEFLSSLPASRSELVNELALPDLYVAAAAPDSLSYRPDTPDTPDTPDSADSSLALSRAMTDSDIEYDMYKRLRARRRSDPWAPLRAAAAELPPAHVAALTELAACDAADDAEPDDYAYLSRPVYDEELVSRMQRYICEECVVFAADDPGLADLQDALAGVDLESLESDEDFYMM